MVDYTFEIPPGMYVRRMDLISVDVARQGDDGRLLSFPFVIGDDFYVRLGPRIACECEEEASRETRGWFRNRRLRKMQRRDLRT